MTQKDRLNELHKILDKEIEENTIKAMAEIKARKEEKEALQGMLIHFLYSFCLCNDLPMSLFKKGKEDLKQRLTNFYKNYEEINNG